LRPFEPRDDEAVVALYARLHAADPSIDAMDLERWRAYRAMKVFEGGRRFLVVEEAGRVIALSTLGDWAGAWRARIFVDPDHRRRGIARALLEKREKDAREEGARAIDCFIEARWDAGHAFAKAHGYRVFVHDLFLRRGSTRFSAAAPEGVRLRPYAGRADDAAWAAISNATLSRDAGYQSVTEADTAGFAQMPGFELWFAEHQGAPVGLCHVERRGELGLVQALAVLGSHEGRGIGAALLSRGIDALVDHGVACIELCTEEDNVRARRLYARAGFTLDREAFTYRMTIA
jgi:mycothiol synthase